MDASEEILYFDAGVQRINSVSAVTVFGKKKSTPLFLGFHCC